MHDIIAITIGDINGIGIEILLNTWKKNKIDNFILLSDVNVIKKYLDKKKINLNLNIVNNKNNNFNFINNKFNIYSYRSKSLEENTYKSLEYAYNLCKNNICKGIITLPLRKDLIIKKIDKKFIGQTEFFQKKDRKKYSNMILYHNRILVSPLTTHIKIKKVSNKISNKKFLYNQLLNLHTALVNDFGFKKPKIIVSGLNPHAGENGKIGMEEKKYLLPVIKNLKKNKVYLDGPFSADGILNTKNIKKYNCFIFIYHDQALIPFKYISKYSGVNYTGNLSIIRTSPDHGTAYDLVGSNKVSANSFLNCFKLIKKIIKNRKINEKS